MTDKELIINAARAIGCTYSEEYQVLFDKNYGNAVEANWKPLDDNIQAFRLALELKINIIFDGSSVRCSRFGDKFVIVGEEFDTNIGSAVRRAIVRVAAKVGESDQKRNLLT